MFGYININRNELSEEDQKIYQSYYCGLCKKLKELCGKRGQILLSYDITFLIVLLTGLYEVEGKVDEFVCAVHPTKRRHMCQNEITEYAAAMNVMLAYHNLIDDWKDERDFKKKTIAGMIRKDYEHFAGMYPRQKEAIEGYIHQLAEYESTGETNIDVVSGVTGEMLGELFAWREDEWYHELKTLGFYMGKFIYLMDAYEDLREDEKKDQYNPLRFLEQEQEENFETFCKLLLTSMMSECAKSFERLPVLLHADIIRNILYSGVWSKYEYIQLKKKRTKR